jgi:hypothetical protein
VAEVGVQAIGEVDRRRPARQVDDAALRRQHVDGVVERGALELAHPLGGVADLVAPRQQLAQPGDLVVVTRILPGAFLVAPVGGDAQLGVAVHLVGADLHFQRPPAGADHGGVQRAVVVALRVGDVVVELLRDRLPDVVHDAEHRVAVLDVADQHAQRAHVVDFGEVEVLRLHLAVDAVDVLRPANYLGLDAGGGQLALQAGDGFLDELLALDAALVELFRDALVGVRFEEAEGEVLQLPLQVPDADAVGERRVDVEALARHLGALGLRMIGQVAQRLRAAGQAQQHDADVRRHRQQHLAQHLGLRLDALRALVLAGHQLQALQPAQAVDQVCHRHAEFGGQLFRRVVEVVGDGEEQRRQPGIQVQPQRGHHQRHADGVLPGVLAGAEAAPRAERLGEVGAAREACARFGRQAFGKQVELRFLGAGLGDGMGDGDHVLDAGTARESGQWGNYR